MQVLEARLKVTDWLAGGQYTFADIAAFIWVLDAPLIGMHAGPYHPNRIHAGLSCTSIALESYTRLPAFVYDRDAAPRLPHAAVYGVLLQITMQAKWL